MEHELIFVVGAHANQSKQKEMGPKAKAGWGGSDSCGWVGGWWGSPKVRRFWEEKPIWRNL